MNNKQVISAALSALTAAAMTRCITTDLPALLELHNTAANAVSALPDTGPLAGSGSSCAEFAVGTLVAGEARPLAAGELVFADPAAEALYTILINVISQHPTARMVNATGPRSSAVRISADGSRHVLVHPLVEIEPGS